MEGSEKTNMKNEERKIDLVKALILSYPLLGESGFKLNKPIALICEDEKKTDFMGKIEFVPERAEINSTDSKAQRIRKKLG